MRASTQIRDWFQGKNKLPSDIYGNDIWYGITVRSEKSYATIKDILFPELPPDITVIRAKDIPGKNSISVYGETVPILANKIVQYRGEPILLIGGKNPELLQELQKQIQIEYEEMPAFTMMEQYAKENIVFELEQTIGNPEEAFRNSFQILEAKYKTGPQEHDYGEPHGAFVFWENDILRILTTSRWPHHVHKSVTDALGMLRRRASVHVPFSGPTLDGKLWSPSLVSTHAALLAYQMKKPVTLIWSFEDDFLYTPKRAPAIITHKTGLNQEGNIIAAEIEMAVNGGAYPVLGKELMKRMLIAGLGVYSCNNIHIQASLIKTHLPPMGGITGIGSAQAFFSMETHASRITEIAQIDPYTWKQKNILRKGEKGITGAKLLSSQNVFLTLDKIIETSDFSRKYASFELLKKRRKKLGETKQLLRGIGISTAHQGTGFIGRGEEQESYAISLLFDKKERITLYTSAIPESSGIYDIWKQKIQSELNIPKKAISIFPLETQNGPNFGPSLFSRNLTIMLRLIENCCLSLKKKRQQAPPPITITRTSKLPRSYDWDDDRIMGKPYLYQSWASSAIEVEINPITFVPKIRNIWIAVEGGKILNSNEAKRTISTGIIQALEWALTEKFYFKHGAIPKQHFLNHHHIPINMLPEPKIYFLEEDTNIAKGIGELPFNCIPAAYSNAVSQATGHYLDKLPITPAQIQEYLEGT